MGSNRFLTILIFTLLGSMSLLSFGQNPHIVVVDSLTRSPLPSASVFNNKGKFVGISNNKGKVTCATIADYPLTIRYLGYFEKLVPTASVDTVFMEENVSELSEVVVETKKQKVLHMLAYVREYSTLSTYTDTVTMFREKMVDFMVPEDDKSRFKGWKIPRTLNSRSYYQFSNAFGLDSISDRCSHHFTWSDWIGVPPVFNMPKSLNDIEIGCDTLRGKYLPSEIWNKKEDRLSIDINVLSDTLSQKWLPSMSAFFHRQDVDFEQVRLHLNFDNVVQSEITPVNLKSYSFNIDSRGRGRDMFQFNRPDQPFFVTSYVEVYIIDKEFITVKEARKWENRKFNPDDIVIFEPMEAPELPETTLALIDRVNQIDVNQIRLATEPDYRLMSRNVSKNKFNMGYRALSMLKSLTGITEIRQKRKQESNWKGFVQKQKETNNSQSQSQKE